MAKTFSSPTFNAQTEIDNLVNRLKLTPSERMRWNNYKWTVKKYMNTVEKNSGSIIKPNWRDYRCQQNT